MKDDHELSDSELESESDSEGEEDAKLSEPSKTAVYNREGLEDKRADISWPENVGWIHKLTVDVDRDQEVDVNDDLARELAFYTQALEGTRQAFGKLESMGLPFLRPADYYAEMVKTDKHMVKVKGKLLFEKKQLEEAEERRKAREAKRIAKEVQAEKQKERAKDKKQQIESVKKWRKQRQQSGFAPNDKDEMAMSFEDGTAFRRPGAKKTGAAPGDRSGGKGGKAMGDKKRNQRDTKFGFGGRKGMKKQNTSDTTSDLRGFNKDKDSLSKNKKRKIK